MKNIYPFMYGGVAALVSVGIAVVLFVHQEQQPGIPSVEVPQAFLDPQMDKIEWNYVQNPEKHDYDTRRHIRCYLNGKMISSFAFPEIHRETTADVLGYTQLKDREWELRVEDEMTGETVTTNFTIHGVKRVDIMPNPLNVSFHQSYGGWL